MKKTTVKISSDAGHDKSAVRIQTQERGTRLKSKTLFSRMSPIGIVIQIESSISMRQSAMSPHDMRRTMNFKNKLNNVHSSVTSPTKKMIQMKEKGSMQ